MRSLLIARCLHVAVALAAVGVWSCGGSGGSSPTTSSTPAPVAQQPWIKIDTIAIAGAFQFDGKNGPAVSWHATYPAGQGASLRVTGYNAANSPCLQERLEATGTGNGRLYLGYPRSVAEWNMCLPRVVRVVAELMPTDTSTAGLAKDELPVQWSISEAREPSKNPTPAPAPKTCCRVCTTGKACGDSCIASTSTCHKPSGCACNG
jgi:hypothetical protein